MASAELRQRKTNDIGLTNGTSVQSEFTPSEKHPVGKPKHGLAMQVLRIAVFSVYFFFFCFTIHFSQLLGLPIRLYSEDWYRAWIAVTKQYFGILITNITKIFAPTTVRVSGDQSVAGQLKQGRDGQIRMHFPERIVYIANHQLYTDWLYMWWAAYTNDPAMHGHIYIILKASLKWTPLIGPAMQLYDFIFMERKWAEDEANMRRNLHKLNTRYSAPLATSQGTKQLDPMWLLIFPEGTNLTQNERNKSAEFSKKRGWPDFKHMVVPRIKGLQLCLQELKNSVEYLYDCTIAYEGVPPGGYGSEIFTLRSVYFQGRPPKSVNMHWRRYRVADLPLDDHDKMFDWIMARWREKDEIIEHFMREGKFPGEVSAVDIEGGPQDEFKTPYISTQVESRYTLEFAQILLPLATAALVGRVLVQLVDRLVGTASLF
ncbi:hypothetical protein AMS68_003942 [Peltaster fructicola]|uniref:Phospholipid/glycerol acyltransferase domain-containing protein n=1 Tax=Peltaster fructicola TaxID=286661 RepID=A0A6H0XUU3_9PEZI|nr:hypothetical protein AMS68_003942 [Peltaster fructicola]